jgi:hypothetical protein
MHIPAALRLVGDGPDIGEQLGFGLQNIQDRTGVWRRAGAGDDGQMAKE